MSPRTRSGLKGAIWGVFQLTESQTDDRLGDFIGRLHIAVGYDQVAAHMIVELRCALPADSAATGPQTGVGNPDRLAASNLGFAYRFA